MQTNKFELVELVINAGTSGSRFNFPDQPKLRYVKLNAIESYDVNDLTVSSTGNALVSAANFKLSYLVLYINGGENVNRIPLISLHRTQSGSSPDPFVMGLSQFQGQQVTWEKSYILTGNSITAASTFSFLLGIYYTC